MNIPPPQNTPPPPPPQSSQPKSLKQNKPSPLYRLVQTKQAKNNNHIINWSTPEKLFHTCKLKPSSKESSLILRDPQRTEPVIWFAAILCMLFILIVIVFGITTLIIYLSVQPRKPSFDTPSAALTGIYFTAPSFLSSDVNFVANFSNPNKKMSVRYESVLVKLYFSESLLAAEAIEPFRLRPGTVRAVSVLMGSRMLNMAPNAIVDLQKQAQANRVSFNVRGSFRVRVKVGPVRYSYWIHELCELEMTNPPVSALVAHSCTSH